MQLQLQLQCDRLAAHVDHNVSLLDEDEMHEWHVPCRAITSEVWKDIGLYEAASGANDARAIIVQHVRPAHPDESSDRMRRSGEGRSAENLLCWEQVGSIILSE
ncbi:hypothetical protein GN958_ATG11184 [Phytophthora infestans]|uniref:Uncharacterized protein n=1 Tax=Phytophthora infestans TaxID=4787 RepID=A0A8S9UKU5_PHYIN|nr:hypothetical protein GN958_ATG11184 [Phytophthora infestans]